MYTIKMLFFLNQTIRAILLNIALTSLFSTFAFSQINPTGIPFTKSYSVKEFAANQNWAALQDNRGVMYFANNNGVLEYDSKTWNLIPLPRNSNVRSLAIDSKGIIYVGGNGEFGCLIPSKNGKLTYLSISANLDSAHRIFSDVWKTYVTGNSVFFQTPQFVFRFTIPLKINYNGTTPELNLSSFKKYSTWKAKTSFHFSFVVNNQFYVREKEVGLKILSSDSLRLVNNGGMFANLRIYCILPFADNKLLIGTRENGFFIYNLLEKNEKHIFVPFPTTDDKLINESQLYHGCQLANHTYALATLRNGVIFMSKEGKITGIYNKKNGAPDDFTLFVYSSYSTNNEKPLPNQSSSLWITSDNYIIRSEYLSPFRQLNELQGLKGTACDIIRIDKTLYAATSTGVYILNQEAGKQAFFEPISGINSESWSFLNYTYPDGKNALLVGTFEGIFEIKGKKAIQICKCGFVYQLHCSGLDPLRVYIGMNDGFTSMYFNKKTNSWIQEKKNEIISGTVRRIQEDKSGNLWMGIQYQGFAKLSQNGNLKIYTSKDGLGSIGPKVFVQNINNQINFATDRGLFQYNESTDKFSLSEQFRQMNQLDSVGVFYFAKTISNYLWINFWQPNKQWIVRYNLTNKSGNPYDSIFARRLPKIATEIIYPEDDGKTWLGSSEGFFCYDASLENQSKPKFSTLIRKISFANDSILFNGTAFHYSNQNNIQITTNELEQTNQLIKYQLNTLAFEFSCSYFDPEDQNVYSFFLEGFDKKWSKWIAGNSFTYTNLPDGDYKFRVKAKNIFEQESTEAVFCFTILPPWYRTIWAYFLYILTFCFLVWTIIKLYTQKLIKEKENLERIVTERTNEILEKNVVLKQQNEEILAQRDEIEIQRDKLILQNEEILFQRDEIGTQKKNITDSIFYASRIQTAVLPPEYQINESLPEHFILFKPKDIVSGDFYWFRKIENKVVLVAADSTGHGVPGAFMSMLGIAFLNEIINQQDEWEAHELLNRLRQKVITSLHQTGKIGEAADGMDLSLCIIDQHTMQAQFAGANNSLYLIRNESDSPDEFQYTLMEFTADRMPIGIHIKAKISFETKKFNLLKNDAIYLFSDGYSDQFGGMNKKKFMAKNLKKLLLEIQQSSMEEQREILIKTHNDWKGNIEQLDDILVLGIKL